MVIIIDGNNVIKKFSPIFFILFFFCSCSYFQNGGKEKAASSKDADRSKTSLPQENSNRQYFTNPILPPPSQDPWMIYYEGDYYYSESDGRNIYIRKMKKLTELGKTERKKIWSPPSSGPNSQNVWAPELHRINDKWYIYYAADDGRNENHRMFVLEAKTDDPQGEYIDKGQINTLRWAIDATILQADDGSLYFVWSGWEGKNDGEQLLFIAKMSDPFTIIGDEVIIARPTEEWERHSLPLCEGPEILKRDNKTFIIYSASGSWTQYYCLGMMVNEDGDFLNPKSWRKVGPVFKKTDTVWGVGHCSFVKSPNMNEDWIIYHAKSKQADGWDDRCIFAQKFSWDDEGFPVFGEPISPGVPLQEPSE